MRILRAADRATVCWKNGGGVTHEVCAMPEAAGFAFGWRLSIAEVHASGPFSRFPGIDRRLAVLKGRMRLAIDRQEPMELRAGASPLSFAGDAETFAEVIAPVTDVNLMTRRDLFHGTLDRIEIDRAVAFVEECAETIILAVDPVSISAGALDPLDAIWCGPGCPATVRPIDGTANILVARIWHGPSKRLCQRRVTSKGWDKRLI